MTVTGTEDAPVVIGIVDGNVTEDVTSTATGYLAISDVDDGDSPSFADTTKAGTYGSFVLAGGTWTYTLDPSTVQALDAGETVDDTVTFTATDGTEQNVTVTVTGTNDAPVISAAGNVSATEDDLNVGIAVSASDSDLLETATDVDDADSSLQIASVNGDVANVGTPVIVTLSFTDANGTAQTQDVQLTVNADGSYAIAAFDLDVLPKGRNATAVFTYQVVDDSGALSSPVTSTITITGTHQPLLSVRRFDDNMFEVSWKSNEADYEIQVSRDGGTNWSPAGKLSAFEFAGSDVKVKALYNGDEVREVELPTDLLSDDFIQWNSINETITFNQNAGANIESVYTGYGFDDLLFINSTTNIYEYKAETGNWTRGYRPTIVNFERNGQQFEFIDNKSVKNETSEVQELINNYISSPANSSAKENTWVLQFTTAEDITDRQVIYHQGDNDAGLVFYLKDEKLYGTIYSRDSNGNVGEQALLNGASVRSRMTYSIGLTIDENGKYDLYLTSSIDPEGSVSTGSLTLDPDISMDQQSLGRLVRGAYFDGESLDAPQGNLSTAEAFDGIVHASHQWSSVADAYQIQRVKNALWLNGDAFKSDHLALSRLVEEPLEYLGFNVSWQTNGRSANPDYIKLEDLNADPNKFSVRLVENSSNANPADSQRLLVLKNNTGQKVFFDYLEVNSRKFVVGYFYDGSKTSEVAFISPFEFRDELEIDWSSNDALEVRVGSQFPQQLELPDGIHDFSGFVHEIPQTGATLDEAHPEIDFAQSEIRFLKVLASNDGLYLVVPDDPGGIIDGNELHDDYLLEAVDSSGSPVDGLQMVYQEARSSHQEAVFKVIIDPGGPLNSGNNIRLDSIHFRLMLQNGSDYRLHKLSDRSGSFDWDESIDAFVDRSAFADFLEMKEELKLSDLDATIEDVKTRRGNATVEYYRSEGGNEVIRDGAIANDSSLAIGFESILDFSDDDQWVFALKFNDGGFLGLRSSYSTSLQNPTLEFVYKDNNGNYRFFDTGFVSLLNQKCLISIDSNRELEKIHLVTATETGGLKGEDIGWQAIKDGLQLQNDTVKEVSGGLDDFLAMDEGNGVAGANQFINPNGSSGVKFYSLKQKLVWENPALLQDIEQNLTNTLVYGPDTVESIENYRQALSDWLESLEDRSGPSPSRAELENGIQQLVETAFYADVGISQWALVHKLTNATHALRLANFGPIPSGSAVSGDEGWKASKTLNFASVKRSAKYMDFAGDMRAFVYFDDRVDNDGLDVGSDGALMVHYLHNFLTPFRAIGSTFLRMSEAAHVKKKSLEVVGWFRSEVEAIAPTDSSGLENKSNLLDGIGRIANDLEKYGFVTAETIRSLPDLQRLNPEVLFLSDYDAEAKVIVAFNEFYEKVKGVRLSNDDGLEKFVFLDQIDAKRSVINSLEYERWKLRDEVGRLNDLETGLKKLIAENPGDSDLERDVRIYARDELAEIQQIREQTVRNLETERERYLDYVDRTVKEFSYVVNDYHDRKSIGVGEVLEFDRALNRIREAGEERFVWDRYSDLIGSGGLTSLAGELNVVNGTDLQTRGSQAFSLFGSFSTLANSIALAVANSNAESWTDEVYNWVRAGEETLGLVYNGLDALGAATNAKRLMGLMQLSNISSQLARFGMSLDLLLDISSRALEDPDNPNLSAAKTALSIELAKNGLGLLASLAEAVALYDALKPVNGVLDVSRAGGLRKFQIVNALFDGFSVVGLAGSFLSRPTDEYDDYYDYGNKPFDSFMRDQVKSVTQRFANLQRDMAIVEMGLVVGSAAVSYFSAGLSLNHAFAAEASLGAASLLMGLVGAGIQSDIRRDVQKDFVDSVNRLLSANGLSSLLGPDATFDEALEAVNGAREAIRINGHFEDVEKRFPFISNLEALAFTSFKPEDVLLINMLNRGREIQQDGRQFGSWIVGKREHGGESNWVEHDSGLQYNLIDGVIEKDYQSANDWTAIVHFSIVEPGRTDWPNGPLRLANLVIGGTTYSVRVERHVNGTTEEFKLLLYKEPSGAASSQLALFDIGTFGSYSLALSTLNAADESLNLSLFNSAEATYLDDYEPETQSLRINHPNGLDSFSLQDSSFANQDVRRPVVSHANLMGVDPEGSDKHTWDEITSAFFDPLRGYLTSTVLSRNTYTLLDRVNGKVTQQDNFEALKVIGNDHNNIVEILGISGYRPYEGAAVRAAPFEVSTGYGDDYLFIDHFLHSSTLDGGGGNDTVDYSNSGGSIKLDATNPSNIEVVKETNERRLLVNVRDEAEVGYNDDASPTQPFYTREILDVSQKPFSHIDTLTNIERVIGTSGDDIFTVGSGNELSLFGGAGKDTFNIEGFKSAYNGVQGRNVFEINAVDWFDASDLESFVLNSGKESSVLALNAGGLNQADLQSSALMNTLACLQTSLIITSKYYIGNERWADELYEVLEEEGSLKDIIGAGEQPDLRYDSVQAVIFELLAGEMNARSPQLGIKLSAGQLNGTFIIDLKGGLDWDSALNQAFSDIGNEYNDLTSATSFNNKFGELLKSDLIDGAKFNAALDFKSIFSSYHRLARDDNVRFIFDADGMPLFDTDRQLYTLSGLENDSGSASVFSMVSSGGALVNRTGQPLSKGVKDGVTALDSTVMERATPTISARRSTLFVDSVDGDQEISVGQGVELVVELDRDLQHTGGFANVNIDAEASFEAIRVASGWDGYTFIDSTSASFFDNEGNGYLRLISEGESVPKLSMGGAPTSEEALEEQNSIALATATGMATPDTPFNLSGPSGTLSQSVLDGIFAADGVDANSVPRVEDGEFIEGDSETPHTFVYQHGNTGRVLVQRFLDGKSYGYQEIYGLSSQNKVMGRGRVDPKSSARDVAASKYDVVLVTDSTHRLDTQTDLKGQNISINVLGDFYGSDYRLETVSVQLKLPDSFQNEIEEDRLLGYERFGTPGMAYSVFKLLKGGSHNVEATVEVTELTGGLTVDEEFVVKVSYALHLDYTLEKTYDGTEIHLLNHEVFGPEDVPNNKLIYRETYVEDAYYSVDVAVGQLERFVPGADRGGNVDMLLFDGLDTEEHIGTSSFDTLLGGRGNDRLKGDGGHDTLYGGWDDDHLYGGLGNDLLDLGHGNDVGYGGQGDDVLRTGTGNDQAYGQAGNDRLYGEGGDNLLSGGIGDDFIENQSGNGVLLGGQGNDSITGGANAETLGGGTGSDLIRGGAGNDFIDGGSGADVLIGGAGSDTFAVNGDRFHGRNGRVGINASRRAFEFLPIDKAADWEGRWDEFFAKDAETVVDYQKDQDKINLAALFRDDLFSSSETTRLETQFLSSTQFQDLDFNHQKYRDNSWVFFIRMDTRSQPDDDEWYEDHWEPANALARSLDKKAFAKTGAVVASPSLEHAKVAVGEYIGHGTDPKGHTKDSGFIVVRAEHRSPNSYEYEVTHATKVWGGADYKDQSVSGLIDQRVLVASPHEGWSSGMGTFSNHLKVGLWDFNVGGFDGLAAGTIRYSMDNGGSWHTVQAADHDGDFAYIALNQEGNDFNHDLLIVEYSASENFSNPERVYIEDLYKLDSSNVHIPYITAVIEEAPGQVAGKKATLSFTKAEGYKYTVSAPLHPSSNDDKLVVKKYHNNNGVLADWLRNLELTIEGAGETHKLKIGYLENNYLLYVDDRTVDLSDADPWSTDEISVHVVQSEHGPNARGQGPHFYKIFGGKRRGFHYEIEGGSPYDRVNNNDRFSVRVPIHNNDTEAATEEIENIRIKVSNGVKTGGGEYFYKVFNGKGDLVETADVSHLLQVVDDMSVGTDDQYIGTRDLRINIDRDNIGLLEYYIGTQANPSSDAWTTILADSKLLVPSSVSHASVLLRVTDLRGDQSVMSLGEYFFDTEAPYGFYPEVTVDSSGIVISGDIWDNASRSGFDHNHLWVRYSATGGSSWTDWSMHKWLGSDLHSINVSLDPGVYAPNDVVIQFKDQAGNVREWVNSDWLGDVSPPSVGTITLMEDTGVSDSDGITRKPFFQVAMYDDSLVYEGVTAEYQIGYNQNGIWYWDDPVSWGENAIAPAIEVPEGRYKAGDVGVRITDVTGQTTEVFTDRMYLIDTTGPEFQFSVEGRQLTVIPLSDDIDSWYYIDWFNWESTDRWSRVETDTLIVDLTPGRQGVSIHGIDVAGNLTVETWEGHLVNQLPTFDVSSLPTRFLETNQTYTLQLDDFTGFSDADGDSFQGIRFVDIPEDVEVFHGENLLHENDLISRSDILSDQIGITVRGPNVEGLSFQVFDGYDYSDSPTGYEFDLVHMIGTSVAQQLLELHFPDRSERQGAFIRLHTAAGEEDSAWISVNGARHDGSYQLSFSDAWGDVGDSIQILESPLLAGPLSVGFYTRDNQLRAEYNLENGAFIRDGAHVVYESVYLEEDGKAIHSGALEGVPNSVISELSGQYTSINGLAQLDIDNQGAWTVTLINDHDDVQSLYLNEVGQDWFDIQTSSGSVLNISVDIEGRNEPSVVNSVELFIDVASGDAVAGNLRYALADADKMAGADVPGFESFLGTGYTGVYGGSWLPSEYGLFELMGNGRYHFDYEYQYIMELLRQSNGNYTTTFQAGTTADRNIHVSLNFYVGPEGLVENLVQSDIGISAVFEVSEEEFDISWVEASNLEITLPPGFSLSSNDPGLIDQKFKLNWESLIDPTTPQIFIDGFSVVDVFGNSRNLRLTLHPDGSSASLGETALESLTADQIEFGAAIIDSRSIVSFMYASETYVRDVFIRLPEGTGLEVYNDGVKLRPESASSGTTEYKIERSWFSRIGWGYSAAADAPPVVLEDLVIRDRAGHERSFELTFHEYDGNSIALGPVMGSAPPLALDLNGDGLDVLSVDESNARYDVDNDGRAEHTAWVGPSDALIGYDANEDGWISGRQELVLSDYVDGAMTDLEGAWFFDSNDDGKIDQQDGLASRFMLWQDLNSDGESEPDELISLWDYGVEAIHLARTGEPETLADGDVQSHGTFEVELSSGEMLTGYDLALKFLA